MEFRLVAVPEDRLSEDASGQGHIIGPPGPFEIVSRTNMAMLMASSDQAVISRAALAVLGQYGSHLLANTKVGYRPDPELEAALETVRQVLLQ